MSALQPPSKILLLKEARAAADFLRMCHRLARNSREARLETGPVVLFPGFGAGERAMQPLRTWLGRCGVHAEHWGLGRNLAGLDIRHDLADIGPTWQLDPIANYRGEAGVPLLCDRAVSRIRERVAGLGEPVTLIGWSLGGTIAREVAREAPECVRRVITLGAPVIGGPKYTAAASRLAARGLDLDWIERQVARRSEIPLQVPIDAVVSRTDAVVATGAAMAAGESSTRYWHVDVAHLGMSINPTLWDLIARLLEEPIDAAPAHAA